MNMNPMKRSSVVPSDVMRSILDYCTGPERLRLESVNSTWRADARLGWKRVVFPEFKCKFPAGGLPDIERSDYAIKSHQVWSQIGRDRTGSVVSLSGSSDDFLHLYNPTFQPHEHLLLALQRITNVKIEHMEGSDTIDLGKLLQSINILYSTLYTLSLHIVRVSTSVTALLIPSFTTLTHLDISTEVCASTTNRTPTHMLIFYSLPKLRSLCLCGQEYRLRFSGSWLVPELVTCRLVYDPLIDYVTHPIKLAIQPAPLNDLLRGSEKSLRSLTLSTL